MLRINEILFVGSVVIVWVLNVFASIICIKLLIDFIKLFKDFGWVEFLLCVYIIAVFYATVNIVYSIVKDFIVLNTRKYVKRID